MSKMKDYAMGKKHEWCCDGINLCVDCDYYFSTNHIYYKYRPSIRTWYNKTTSKAEEKIREYFKKKKKKEKVEIPF